MDKYYSLAKRSSRCDPEASINLRFLERKLFGFEVYPWFYYCSFQARREFNQNFMRYLEVGHRFLKFANSSNHHRYSTTHVERHRHPLRCCKSISCNRFLPTRMDYRTVSVSGES